MSEQLISSNITLSPNEYVTKYAINRNFKRLCENDAYLSAHRGPAEEFHVSAYSYVKNREYNAGDYVFYKASPDGQSLYLLSSCHDNNQSQPYVYQNKAGDYVVRSDSNWGIVGIPQAIAEQCAGRYPTDVALEYINVNVQDFLANHQLNTAMSVHPTGRLGLDESTILYTSLDNASPSRSSFFYPNQLQSLNPDNTIVNGYMRQWENGLLEYDITFRVGFGGEYDENNLPVISANNLKVFHRGQNNFYFKDEADFSIFSKNTRYKAIANRQQFKNLDVGVNAFCGEIKFPVEFKDLNYSVFTSNVKNVETDAYSVNNDILTASQYDNRLYYDGLAITGHDINANYAKPVIIPNQIRNIGYSSLAYIEEVDGTELRIVIDSDESQLVNIGGYAFEGSDIRAITVPRTCRCIGQGAFANCTKLKTVDIYLSKNIIDQPKIDFDVFSNNPALSGITLHYFSPLLAAASTASRNALYSNEIDLSVKLTDETIRQNYGIGIGVTPAVKVLTVDVSPIVFAASAPVRFDPCENSVEDIAYSGDAITITPFEFIRQMKAGDSVSLNSLGDYDISAGALYGYRGYGALDFTRYELARVHAIAPSAFMGNERVTDLIVDDRVSSIADLAFAASALSSITVIRNKNGYNFLQIGDNAFSGCDISQACLSNVSERDARTHISIDNVESLSVIGTGTLFPGISCGRAGELTISGFSLISEGALSGIGSINRVTVIAPPDGTIFDSRCFNGVSGRTYGSFNIVGDNITLRPFSLCDTVFENGLSLDMRGSYIYRNAFSGSDVGKLRIANADFAKRPYMSDRVGFDNNALAGCSINVISAPDGDLPQKAFTFNHIPNIASVPENTRIGEKLVVRGGAVTAAPASKYFCIYDDPDLGGYTLVSCIWPEISATIDEGGWSVVNVPDGVTTIGVSAFCRTDSRSDLCAFTKSRGHVSEINLPASISAIHQHSISGYTGLQAVNFRKSTQLQRLGDNIFGGNMMLQRLIIVGDEPDYDLMLRNVDNAEFQYKTSETGNSIAFLSAGQIQAPYNAHFTDKNKVEAVQSYTNRINGVAVSSFNNCQQLRSVEMGGIVRIETSAFHACTALSSVIFDTVEFIGSQSFNGCGNLSTVLISAASKTAVLEDTDAFDDPPPCISVNDILYRSYIVAENWRDISSAISSITQPSVSFLSDHVEEPSPVVSVVIVNYSMSAQPPEVVPEKRGYEFTGWEESSYVVQDITCYAKWNMMEYGIQYQPDGIEVSGEHPTTYNITSDIVFGRPISVGYLGYFNPRRIERGETGDKVVTAEDGTFTEPIEYKIEYDLRGGEEHTNPTHYNVTSETISLDPASRTGFDFVAWKDADQNVSVSIPTGTYGDIYLSAYWQAHIPADALKFIAVRANSTIRLCDNASKTNGEFEYSYDYETWTDYTAAKTITLQKIGDVLYFRAKEKQSAATGQGTQRFRMTGKIKAFGNINYLISNSGAVEGIDIADYCYSNLFYSCGALITPPDLPLQQAPSCCYYQMFQGCTALSAPPDIGLTSTSEKLCYKMFSGCTSLKVAPVLKPKTLENECYFNMFSGCSRLSSVTSYHTDWNKTGKATTNWLYNVTAKGEFWHKPELDMSERGNSTVPPNWSLSSIQQ